MTVRAFLAPHIAELKKSYAVSVVANFGGDGPPAAGDGVEFVSIPIARRIAPWHDLVAFLSLVRLFRLARFSAIQSVTPKVGLLAMLAGWIARVPVRIHVCTGQTWVTQRGIVRGFLKLMDRIVAGCATHLLVDSPSQREFLLAEGVVSADRSRVLAKGSIAGVDATRFKPDPQARHEIRSRLDYPEDSVVFLFLGRLNREKGVLDLAAAFAQLAQEHDKVRLLFVGPDEENLRGALERQLGAAARHAAFAGDTGHPEAYLAAADVFCLPSYREGFGVTVIEAGACGVPAIGSRIYGITDAIEDGVTGLLFEPHSIEALAQHMGHLARDPGLRRRMGERARAKALRDFPVSAVVGELVRLYEQAVGASR